MGFYRLNVFIRNISYISLLMFNGMKNIFLFFLLFQGFYSSAQQHDNPLKTSIDSAVHKLMGIYTKDGKRVGISIGINYNGKSSTYNYGETQPGSGILPTQESVYEIGSNTKTFTGLLIAHAISEGKIALSDDVRKFLPEPFPNLQYPNGDAIKIGYLLAHTAQLPNSFADPLTTTMDEASFYKQLHQVKLDTLRGFKYAYSNVGYQLLGLILERTYHKSFESLVDKYITGPLGMTRTKLTYTNSNLPLTGYDDKKNAVNPIPLTLPAAGGLRSSVSDMLKYLNYQNQENTPEVRATHRIIFGNVDQESYGYQWAIGKTWNWDQYIRTDGGTKGFRTFYIMYPQTGVSIVILTNQKDDMAGLELYKACNGIYAAIKKDIHQRNR
jgi:D-alanyl-D-alanine-carboxypeptidase/D-alanyl-D-alanine-endopeptidase